MDRRELYFRSARAKETILRNLERDLVTAMKERKLVKIWGGSEAGYFSS